MINKVGKGSFIEIDCGEFCRSLIRYSQYSDLEFDTNGKDRIYFYDRNFVMERQIYYCLEMVDNKTFKYYRYIPADFN